MVKKIVVISHVDNLSCRTIKIMDMFRLWTKQVLS